ncbi:MAG TPA: hypothetical protein VGK31_11105 [Thermoanaerobaculia bacterium]|jgi:hypothetical protein
MAADLYDRQYRKIVELMALPQNGEKRFETGGVLLLLRRSGDEVSAFDVSDGRGREPIELPVETRDGWVWVCVEANS